MGPISGPYLQVAGFSQLEDTVCLRFIGMEAWNSGARAQGTYTILTNGWKGVQLVEAG